jgi:hypothetical protein
MQINTLMNLRPVQDAAREKFPATEQETSR